LDVLAKYPGATFQVIVDTFMRMTAVASIERMARLCSHRRIRLQWLGAATYEFQDKMGIRAPIAAMHERFKAEGRDFWTSFSHVPAASSISFLSSLVFAQSNNYVWHDVILERSEEAKLALLENPEWRDRARESWDKTWPQSSLSRPDGIGIRLRAGRRDARRLYG